VGSWDSRSDREGLSNRASHTEDVPVAAQATPGVSYTGLWPGVRRCCHRDWPGDHARMKMRGTSGLWPGDYANVDGCEYAASGRAIKPTWECAAATPPPIRVLLRQHGPGHDDPERCRRNGDEVEEGWRRRGGVRQTESGAVGALCCNEGGDHRWLPRLSGRSVQCIQTHFPEACASGYTTIRMVSI
jgi:hypothetical protein